MEGSDKHFQFHLNVETRKGFIEPLKIETETIKQTVKTEKKRTHTFCVFFRDIFFHAFTSISKSIKDYQPTKVQYRELYQRYTKPLSGLI